MAATMILGALLVVSVSLTVYAWVSRNSAIAELNKKTEKETAAEAAGVHKERKRHLIEDRMDTSLRRGCHRCVQLMRQLRGAQAEARAAEAILTPKQKRELYATHDIIVRNVKIISVADPSAPSRQRLEITFNMKNQCAEPRGNILGVFELFNGKKLVWHKEFSVAELDPGRNQDVVIKGPEHAIYDAWHCDVYPSIPTDEKGLPRYDMESGKTRR